MSQPKIKRPVLPIDSELERSLELLEQSGVLILQAEPGAGKTTRFPIALLDRLASLKGSNQVSGEVWVLEPRRVAARLSAERVSEELGTRVGTKVGYQTRMDSWLSRETRLLYLTEGLFLRRLADNPSLKGVAAIVIDEFHERSLQADLAIALVSDLQKTQRPDLKIVVMSATLDLTELRTFFPRANLLQISGRVFPVEIEYLEDARPSIALARARDFLGQSNGDLLFFLPGMREIRQAQSEVSDWLRSQRLDWVVAPFHSELTESEQRLALEPLSAEDRRLKGRKVILATNIAETSITLPDVKVVIDSGLHRSVSTHTWSGMSELKTREISRASAKQRAGRAGRVSAGLGLRLYSLADFSQRRAFELPEIRRAEISHTCLELLALGHDPWSGFDWFEAPEPGQLARARDLLKDLGAIRPEVRQASGSVESARIVLTEIGIEMARSSLHPRLARVWAEAQSQPELKRFRSVVARWIACLSESQFATQTAHMTERSFDFGRQVPFSVTHVERKLLGEELAGKISGALDLPVVSALLKGFGDQVGRVQSSGRDLVVELASGGRAEFWRGRGESQEPTPKNESWILVLEAREHQQKVMIERWLEVDELLLLDSSLPLLKETQSIGWQGQVQSPVLSQSLTYGKLTLSQSQSTEIPQATRVAALADRLLGEQTFWANHEFLASLSQRLSWAWRVDPEGMEKLEIPQWSESFRRVLAESAAQFASNMSEIKAVSWESVFEEGLTEAQRKSLVRALPTSVQLTPKRKALIHYELHADAPWIESRMQDFFGVREIPRVLNGRVPVVLRLLAPNYRPVQITQDLAGFWKNHYPKLRGELSRRYPRHAWPEDPTAAFVEPSDVKGSSGGNRK
jgi:ATP-dependent helicase HrpB